MFKSDAPASLSSVLAQSPSLKKADRVAWSTWRAVVGHRVAKHTMPSRVDEDTLHVIVSSSLWASELSLLQAPILQKLRAFLPGIRLLRFRVGHIEVPALDEPPVRIVSAALPQALEEKLSEMADKNLSEAIREAARYSIGRAARGPNPDR